MKAPSLVLILLLAPTFPSCAEETKPADPNGKAAAASKPAPATKRTFTNKDLEKYRSARSSGNLVVDMNAVQRAKDEASPPKDENAIYPDEKARRIADLQQSIKEAEARGADLDKRLAFLANPYLPPPQVSADEVQAQKGMSQKEAYQALQAEKAALVEKIAGLHADLDRLIATPTQPRAGAVPPTPDANPPPQP